MRATTGVTTVKYLEYMIYGGMFVLAIGAWIWMISAVFMVIMQGSHQ